MQTDPGTLQAFENAALEAAKAGGEVLLTHLSRIRYYEVHSKDDFDFATEVDHASERAIIERLRRQFPNHQILAEESGERAGPDDFCWIIDPLDGTTNYLHDVRSFAISIALMHGGELIVGVVYDPVRGETFSARKQQGAYLNSSRIHVSGNTRPGDCLLATGFPFRQKDLISPYLEIFERVFRDVRGIRRIGAAALDLAYVAAGRFDGFFEYILNKWDFAAGVLLIQEAGGVVTGFDEHEDYWASGNILASNGLIHPYLLAATEASEPAIV